MFFKPHQLYRIINPVTQTDGKGNPIKDSGYDMKEFIDGCFLHDIGIREKSGYLGKGIEVTYFINLERNRNLAYGMEVLVMDGDDILGRGKIVDIKHTSGHINNYTTIYI